MSTTSPGPELFSVSVVQDLPWFRRVAWKNSRRRDELDFQPGLESNGLQALATRAWRCLQHRVRSTAAIKQVGRADGTPLAEEIESDRD
jgi:hypothetical protein